MKIWIDDIRYPPTYYPWMSKYLPRFISRWLTSWVWVKNSIDAWVLIHHAVLAGDPIKDISFDHDLGGDDTTVEIADFIEELAYYNKVPRIEWHIHSANPVGRRRLKAALDQADAYWTHNELLEKNND